MGRKVHTRRCLQLYVFVAKCIAYHFNAKQPTDMARRQLKASVFFGNRESISLIGQQVRTWSNQGAFQCLPQRRNHCWTFANEFHAIFTHSQIPADEAFTKAIESYYEVFLKSERVAKVVQAGGFSANDFREVLNNINGNYIGICFFRCSAALWSVGYGHCRRLMDSAKIR